MKVTQALKEVVRVPKIVDHDQRRAEIIRNARELIGEQGLEAMTLRRLAERCGLANGALRRYFRFKHDVLLALDEDIVQRFGRYAEREGYAEQRGLRALQTLIDALLPLDQERAVNAEVLATLRDHALGDQDFAATFHRRLGQLFDQAVVHLEQARADGQIGSGRSIEVTAAILVNTVVGISMTSSIGEHRDLAKYDAAAVKAILDSA